MLSGILQESTTPYSLDFMPNKPWYIRDYTFLGGIGKETWTIEKKERLIN